MRHVGTEVLQTSRLILRRFTVEDAEAMYTNWGCDPHVTKFMAWPPHETVETSKSILTDWVKQYEKEETYNWAIIFGENGDEPIGAISVTKINETINAVEIGYCIGNKWWNQGVMTEALKCVISFLFTEVGANRIEARHDIDNPASGKVMQKCGMSYEGTLRAAGINNQGICDESVYAIIKSDVRSSSTDMFA